MEREAVEGGKAVSRSGAADVTAVTWSRSHHPHRAMLASERYETIAE
jgi:hypothetical protein